MGCCFGPPGRPCCYCAPPCGCCVPCCGPRYPPPGYGYGPHGPPGYGRPGGYY